MARYAILEEKSRCCFFHGHGEERAESMLVCSPLPCGVTLVWHDKR